MYTRSKPSGRECKSGLSYKAFYAYRLSWHLHTSRAESLSSTLVRYQLSFKEGPVHRNRFISLIVTLLI